MQIDLEEIAFDASTIRSILRHESNRSCVTIPKVDALRVADALEALPKLVEALRAADSTFDYLRSVTGGDSESAQLVKQALESFNQPQP